MKIERLSSYKNITDDSKKVESGSIFVAIKGYSADGHDFILDAISNGAALIIADKRYVNYSKLPKDIHIITVEDSRAAFAEIASQMYSLPKNIIGVTGTNGKTSVTYFYKQILDLIGEHVASIGTLGVVSNSNSDYFKKFETLTTPGISNLYYILDQLHKNNVENVIIELSSHGLHQRRMKGIKFNIGAFTSFSQDHLDYHKTMKEYLEAKKLMFSEILSPGSKAIINADMDVSADVVKLCKDKERKVFTYGDKGEYIKLLSLKFSCDVTKVRFTIGDDVVEIDIPVIGVFQIHNILCALALAIQSGYDKDKCIKALSSLHSVPGRMELVKENIIVDYAHTDDALLKAMLAIKEIMSSGKLIVLFGCGGDRDKKKRKLMGEVVDKIADVAIVTDDNPRTEDPGTIRREIMRYCNNAVEVDGRENAIKKALELKGKEDFLLIAGKGHEDYQIIGAEKVPFDDAQMVRDFLK
ncbi:MAG: UDP-N-acetylmuramoyl-L-alanyl-D-glutamate--2,6-diaminopimelate ligase [Alphaproteobacteria bacterium]|nr:UDP-N-acetylmuramoyl-L-alanyl-D-glutamate--2,6-diaminopimelate ligase [Alphaproteobacteria bacterium]